MIKSLGIQFHKETQQVRKSVSKTDILALQPHYLKQNVKINNFKLRSLLVLAMEL